MILTRKKIEVFLVYSWSDVFNLIWQRVFHKVALVLGKKFLKDLGNISKVKDVLDHEHFISQRWL